MLSTCSLSNPTSAVNTGKRSLEMVHHVVFGPPTLVLLLFLVLYVSSNLVFGGIFWVFGSNCFRLEDDAEFSFLTALWISVHIFSTVGFGNLAPRQTCPGAQMVVLLEALLLC